MLPDGLGACPTSHPASEAIPLRGLEGVPGLPGAPQDEAGLTRKFEMDVFLHWLFDIYYLEQASVRFQ